MGCEAEFLTWMSTKGVLPRRGRMLDIGESCLLDGEATQFKEIVRRHGCKMDDAKLGPLLTQLAWRSTLRSHPTTQTLFLAEVIELTEVEYVSFDVVRARWSKPAYPQVHLFDLNVHSLAPASAGTFDLVINMGTSEHVVNQFNAFKVIHEAAKPGGCMFHQAPSTGWINHGYYCYDALMFEELAQANDYEILDLWFYGPMHPETVLVNAGKFPGVMDASKPRNDVEAFKNTPVASCNINVLMRKVHDAPFRVGLEMKTAAGRLDQNASYTSEYIDTPFQVRWDRLEAQLAQAQGQLAATEAQLAKTDGQLARTEDQLARTEGQLARTEGQLARTEDQLDKANGSIAWMKTSKFWKTRDACVRFKRSLGALSGRGAAG